MKNMRSFRQSESGQVVLEYVLLLVIGVSIAIVLQTSLVSRNPESPGLIIKKWSSILQVIGTDLADDTSDE